MTPFELNLGHELDIERQRFDSEWLFQWYNIKSDRRIVDVPDYKGGRITVGGVRFEGTVPLIYWQALGRYLNGKVHEIFRRWDQETKPYPAELRRSSLDGTERLLRLFVAGIMERANRTDQALRGDGTPKTDKSMEGGAAHSHANAEIIRLTQAHQALLPALPVDPQATTWRSRLVDALNLRPGMFGLNIDLKSYSSGTRGNRNGELANTAGRPASPCYWGHRRRTDRRLRHVSAGGKTESTGLSSERE